MNVAKFRDRALEELYGFLLPIAKREAADSLDPSTKVGGAMLRPTGEVWTGHNRFVSLAGPQVIAATREERYADVIHAEESILLRAGGYAGHSTYVGTHEPCARCWRLLVYAQVAAVAFPVTDPERRARWGCDEGRAIAEREGLYFREFPA